MDKPVKRYMVTYTSSMNRSAGDEAFKTKSAALSGFTRLVAPVVNEFEAVVNLQVHTLVGGSWNIRTLAAKYAGENGARIFPEFFAA